MYEKKTERSPPESGHNAEKMVEKQLFDYLF